MYTIYADGELLYSPRLTEEGWVIFDGKLTEELNKSGSLEFTMPSSNPMYDRLKKLKTKITVKSDNTEIWWGRVLNDEKDFFNKRHVYCEGILSYLLDSIVRPYDADKAIWGLFADYIRNHNAQVDDDKKFNIYCRAADWPDTIHRASSQYPNTLNEITEKLLNNGGGYISATGGNSNTIYYRPSSGEQSDQVIQFGENLLDLSEYVDATNVFTRLVPLGKQVASDNGAEGRRVTIESVNNGKDYVEDTGAERIFGTIERTMIWEDVEEPSNLIKRARDALRSNIEMSVTLNVKAIDLHLIDVKTERIKLGDYIRVVSKPHGLDKNFLCSKIVTDLLNPDKTEFTLGVGFSALTDRQVAIAKQSQNAYVESVNASSTASQISVNVSGNYLSTSDFKTYEKQVNDNFDAVNKKLASVYHVKGSVPSYQDLPTAHTVGDVYNLLVHT